MKNNDNQHYCSDLTHKSQPDMFLASLFVPPDARRDLHVLYAFAAEIAAIRTVVTEELLAHIRYAWWAESLGKPNQAHPVLEMLTPLIQNAHVSIDGLTSLIEQHRSHYPEALTSNEMLYGLSEALLESAYPNALNSFKKGAGVIQAHRQVYGQSKNSWLYMKLLMKGVF